MRKIWTLSEADAALQKLLGVLAPGTSLFTPGGRLIFSNLEQQPGWVGLVEQIQMMLPCLTVGNEPVQRELEWKGELLFLSAFGLEHCGQRCLCIQVRQAQTMPVETGKGVTITHRNEPLFNDVSRVGCAVLVGEIGRRIPAYYQSIWPVLILGETGTGKDTVASILYRNGPFHEQDDGDSGLPGANSPAMEGASQPGQFAVLSHRNYNLSTLSGSAGK